MSVEEHSFRVRYSGKSFKSKWGTATVVGGTHKQAVADVKDGYRRLGFKVLELKPAVRKS